MNWRGKPLDLARDDHQPDRRDHRPAPGSRSTPDSTTAPTPTRSRSQTPKSTPSTSTATSSIPNGTTQSNRNVNYLHSLRPAQSPRSWRSDARLLLAQALHKRVAPRVWLPLRTKPSSLKPAAPGRCQACPLSSLPPFVLSTSQLAARADFCFNRIVCSQAASTASGETSAFSAEQSSRRPRAERYRSSSEGVVTV